VDPLRVGSMREPLFTDRQDITTELALLLKNKTPLNFYQQSIPVQPALIRGVDLKHEPPLVVILKKSDFQAEEGGGCLLYRPNGQVSRVFNGTILKQSEHHLGILLPAEIFRLQRRKSGRCSTPPPSKGKRSRHRSPFLLPAQAIRQSRNHPRYRHRGGHRLDRQGQQRDEGNGAPAAPRPSGNGQLEEYIKMRSLEEAASHPARSDVPKG
jgi:hypothetical protein